ncbi:MAG TPA: hypothetical protein VGP26_04060 [Actinophytocola sp.]|jgi:hypothetical protein|nr:hypothetical protein [Actinophytocola sp.]
MRFELTFPAGWRPVPPAEAGAISAAVVAVHEGPPDGGFTANLTVTEQHPDPRLPLAVVAEESVRRLAAAAAGVRIRQRTPVGTPDAPGLAQVLDLTVAGQPSLVQCQVYVALGEPAARVVLELVLTCTKAQLDDVFDGFQEFVAGVRPAG